jgi:hypothetical protein
MRIMLKPIMAKLEESSSGHGLFGRLKDIEMPSGSKTRLR